MYYRSSNLFFSMKLNSSDGKKILNGHPDLSDVPAAKAEPIRKDKLFKAVPKKKKS